VATGAETSIELTTAEAAALAGVSDRTIRNWIKDGLLKAHKLDEGRRIRKDDLLAHLRERANSVAGVLGQEALMDKPAEVVTETVAAESAAETTPEPHPNGHTAQPHLRLVTDEEPEPPPTPVLTPELINMVLQPLREELEAERREKRRLHEENVELAGRIGYYQAELAQYKDRVLLLEAPKGLPEVLPLTQPPMAAPEDPNVKPVRLPWYKRIFATE